MVCGSVGVWPLSGKGNRKSDQVPARWDNTHTRAPTSCSHPQITGGDTGTNWHTVSLLNIYSQYGAACSWRAVLSMLVNVALINRWGFWLGLSVATDGDLFLCCDEGGEGGEKERKGKEAQRTRRKERSQERMAESVTEIRTHWSFTKQRVNNVWQGFHCNSF